MANEPALVSLRLNIVSGSILYLQMRFQSIAFCLPFHTSENRPTIMSANPLKERLFLKLNPASIPRRDPVTRQQEINPDTQVARYGNQKKCGRNGCARIRVIRKTALLGGASSFLFALNENQKKTRYV